MGRNGKVDVKFNFYFMEFFSVVPVFEVVKRNLSVKSLQPKRFLQQATRQFKIFFSVGGCKKNYQYSGWEKPQNIVQLS